MFYLLKGDYTIGFESLNIGALLGSTIPNYENLLQKTHRPNHKLKFMHKVSNTTSRLNLLQSLDITHGTPAKIHTA